MEEIIKAIIIKLYQFFYWFLSHVIKRKKYDVVLIARHNNNVKNYLQMHPTEIVGVITDNKKFRLFLEKNKRAKKIVQYQAYNPFSAIAQIIMILQTEKVVIDDYYPPLFVIDKTKEVWNIWHSYAIYKKIGLVSPVYRKKGALALDRYQRNYQRIDKLFVRSDIEQDIFKHSYDLSDEQIIIDKRFYRSQYANLPHKIKKTKTIVYAPTFRLYPYNFIAVYENLKQQFPEYTVVVSFHQTTLRDYPKLRKLHNPLPLPTLLEDAAIFMTDYSGLLIEISDLDKDIEVYQVLDVGDYVKFAQTSGLNEGIYQRPFSAIRIERDERS